MWLKLEKSFWGCGTLHIQTLPSFPPRISNLLLWIEWNWHLLGRSVRGIVGSNLAAAAADTIRWAWKRRGSASLKAQPSNLGHLYSIHVTLPSVNIQKSARSWWHFNIVIVCKDQWKNRSFDSYLTMDIV